MSPIDPTKQCPECGGSCEPECAGCPTCKGTGEAPTEPAEIVRIMCECGHSWIEHQGNADADYYCSYPACGCGAYTVAEDESAKSAELDIEAILAGVIEEVQTVKNFDRESLIFYAKGAIEAIIAEAYQSGLRAKPSEQLTARKVWANELRLQGKTVREIVAEMGLKSPGSVSWLLKKTAQLPKPPEEDK